MRRVLVLEDDDDLRGLLCELLRTSGVEECVGVASYEALLRQREAALACGLALLDVNLGADVPSGLDAYRWLREQGFAGRAVFLTGHARSHPLVRQAHALTGVQVLSKPVDADVLVGLAEAAAQGPRAP